MVETLPERMTADEYLAWEARQETKHEFDGIRPVAITGGTWAHSRVQGNLITALNTRLRGGPCQPCGPDMRLPTGSGRYRYPDAMVTCRPIDRDASEVPDPVVVFEVLAEGTERIDKRVKLVEYRSIPSLLRYVMVEQDEPYLTVVARTGHGWSLDVLRGGATLAMPEIGIVLAVDELYAGLPPAA
jgi:Uma2 family endonuclease